MNDTENKAIEEMCEVLRQNADSCKTCDWRKEGLCVDNCELAEDNHTVCETLYNAGYRKQKEGENVSGTPSLYECSVCHWYDWDTTTGDTSDYNYCPNCGAKMKGGE